MTKIEDILESWLSKTFFIDGSQPVSVEKFLYKVFGQVGNSVPDLGIGYDLEEYARFDQHIEQVGDFGALIDLLDINNRPSAEGSNPRSWFLNLPNTSEGFREVPAAINSAYFMLNHLVREGKLSESDELVQFMRKGQKSITALASRLNLPPEAIR